MNFFGGETVKKYLITLSVGLVLAGCETPDYKEVRSNTREGISAQYTSWAQLVNATQLEIYGTNPTFPCATPDGECVVYCSKEKSLHTQIFMRKLNSTTTSQLTYDDSDHLYPSISPDGKKIAFASNRHGNWDIFIMDLSTPSFVEQVTFTKQDETAPSFSPDGKKVAVMVKGIDETWQIAIIDTKSRQITYLGNGAFPKWNPKRDLIAYESLSMTTRRTNINVVNSDGSSVTEIVVDRSGKKSMHTPTWSPDGEWLAFAVSNEQKPDYFSWGNQHDDIWICRADGSNVIIVLDDIQPDWYPSWGGDTIYFASIRKTYQNIYAVKLPMERLKEPKQ